MATNMETTGMWIEGNRVTSHVWGMMDLSGTPHADLAYNIDSVTDLATGRAQIDFSNNFAAALYAATTTTPSGYISGCVNYAASNVELRTGDSNWTYNESANPVGFSLLGN